MLGRCCVLSVRDYYRCKPENFDEKDIYVCESRYSSKARAFKKIKVTLITVKVKYVKVSNQYHLSSMYKILRCFFELLMIGGILSHKTGGVRYFMSFFLGGSDGSKYSSTE